MKNCLPNSSFLSSSSSLTRKYGPSTNAAIARDSSQCTKPMNMLKVEVAHGSDRHSIELNMDDDIRVCHLQNEIAERTGVHPCNQRIYYRGQHLEHCPQSRLVDFHVFNNSSLTLVGYPPEKHNPACKECDMCVKRYSTQLNCNNQGCPDDPRRKCRMNTLCENITKT